MKLKTKTIAGIASLLIVSNAVGAQASTAISLQHTASLCAGGFAGCVLPAKTAPVPTAAPSTVPAEVTPVVEEAKKSKAILFASLAAAAAIVAGIIIVADSDDDAPTSP